MITYLMQQLHLPLVHDSFAGRLWTIAAAGVFSQLGMLGLVGSALVPALCPAPCCAAATAS
uniref:Uncharacterized protein n=1 Tax=Oryza glumipatula TaxID=40148 RepID=A0A0E0AH57_9ORYZ